VADPERHARPLLERDLLADPLEQFGAWFEEAGRVTRMPEEVAVATATPDGAPSVRMVLMKGYDEHGFVFNTNYLSRKAGELDSNPRAALLFYWEPLGRQVRIEGPAERCSSEESERFILSRPRASRLSAMASGQSQVVESRDALEAAVAELGERYRDSELPVPGDWGCYRVRPESYEFWQHRNDRLHDRLRYVPEGGAWRIERLGP
jgi:pyridoxamine 5'-phosphate oxidase